MRIDEFSAPADIDGTLDTTEITRFLLFGFDIEISTVVIVLWSENYRIKSKISLKVELNSHITLSRSLDSGIVTTLRIDSTIIERGYEQ